MVGVDKKSKKKSKESGAEFGTVWAATNPSSASRSCPTKTYVSTCAIACISTSSSL